jgi:hypothetical protein
VSAADLSVDGIFDTLIFQFLVYVTVHAKTNLTPHFCEVAFCIVVKLDTALDLYHFFHHICSVDDFVGQSNGHQCVLSLLNQAASLTNKTAHMLSITFSRRSWSRVS